MPRKKKRGRKKGWNIETPAQEPPKVKRIMAKKNGKGKKRKGGGKNKCIKQYMDAVKFCRPKKRRGEKKPAST